MNEDNVREIIWALGFIALSIIGFSVMIGYSLANSKVDCYWF